MLKTDIHTHTIYAHGQSTVKEMFEKGKELGLKVHGFSEHSPRPYGYDYPNEYRETLKKNIHTYVSEVKELQQNQNDVKVLFGMEIDWIEDQQEFVQNVVKSQDFDYIIGGIHFLGTWGFDAQAKDWENLSYTQRSIFFESYYKTMQKMIKSQLFNIIAHPDLIKIFAIEDFKKWIAEEKNIQLIRETLEIAKEYKIAMEVSTAGLRKPCKEIYPCKEIMQIASELQLPITLGSDGHCVNTLCAYFDELEFYIKKFGYTSYVYYEKNKEIKVDI